MKQFICLLFTIYFFSTVKSQNVAINTDGSAANNSAMLDIKSTNKGVLVPRMSTAQRTGIITPATGLLVYDTDTNNFWFYDGNAWTNLMGSGGGANWTLSGNSGTSAASDFIGTIDNQSLKFKVNNQQYGLIDVNGSIQWGNQSGLNNTGYSNIAIGAKALFNNSDRHNIIAIGDSALLNNGVGVTLSTQAIANIAVGSKALYSNTTGNRNSAFGFESLKANTSANLNASFGYRSLASNTLGANNTAIGSMAMELSTTGSHNVAIGSAALHLNTTGQSNTSIGTSSMGANTTGVFNTAVGSDGLDWNTIGSRNNAFGALTMSANTEGNQNTAVGYQSLNANTTGSFNVALGNSALTGNITGNYNTALGYNADISSGNLSNATAIGYNAMVNVSNKVVIGNSSVTSIGGFANWSNFSDGRFKQNVKEDVPGLSFINKLRPVTYTLNIDAINEFNSKDLPADKKQQVLNADKKKEVYTGFMAQEVEQAARSLNYAFSGIDKPKDESKQTYALRYSDFVVPLVKAIQEQQKMIDDLKKEIEALKKK